MAHALHLGAPLKRKRVVPSGTTLRLHAKYWFVLVDDCHRILDGLDYLPHMERLTEEAVEAQ